jgi:hypothetical protein
MAKHKDKHPQPKPAKSSQTLNNLFSKNRTYLLMLLGLLFIFFVQLIFKRGFMWEDFLEQNFPYRLFAARSLHDGVFPFWNPYIFGGLPFFADVQTGTLFPTNLLLTIFVTGRWLSSYFVEIVMILHLLVAGIGMFYFGLNNKLSKPTSFFMGMVYMLNGSFIVHLTHTQQVQTFVLIPFIFLFLQKGLNEAGIKSICSIIACGLLLGLAGLAGYPQAVVIIITGVILYFIYQIITTPKRFGHILASGIILMAISGLIVACQYLTTFSLFKQTLRGTYTYKDIVEGSFHPLRFITFLIPNYFGTTAQGDFNNYFGPGPYYQFWEEMAYLGIIPLILVAFSFYKKTRKEIVLPIILSVVSLLIGLGKYFPVHFLLYKFVPFFKDIRTPAKFLNLTIFGLVWMSGIGLENIITLKPKAKRLLLSGVIISVICLVLILFLPQQISSDVRSIAVKDAIRSVFIIMLGVLFIRMYLRDSVKKNWFYGLIIILAFLDIFIFGYKYNSGKTDPELYWGTNRIVDFFKSENQKELTRVNIRSKEGLILPRNIGYVQEFATTDGYNPLSLQRFQKASQTLDRDRFFTLMNVKYITALDSATNRLTIQPREFYLSRAKLFYDWEVNSNPESLLNELNQPVFPLDTKVMLEQDVNMERPIDITVANGTAKITSYSLNKIKVDVLTQSPALLVLSENYFPNWQVKINGIINKTIPVDYFLRGCVVPAGQSQVEFYYHETYFSVLFMISLVTILLAIIFIILCNLFYFNKSNMKRTEGYGRVKTTT